MIRILSSMRWISFNFWMFAIVFVSISVNAAPVEVQQSPVNSNQLIADTANEKCLKDNIEVLRSSVQCEVKEGCQKIVKSDECCPQYECNCIHGGKLYPNGETFADVSDVCRKCVCKGGETTCSDIKCYVREDCQPQNKTGVCCPAYSNCPPLDDSKINDRGETPLTTASTTAQAKHEIDPSKSVIKIKETTKPEEIRITDDKPKAFDITKLSSTSTTTSTTTDASTTVAIEQSTDSNESTTNGPQTTTSLPLMTTTSSAATESSSTMQSVESTTAFNLQQESSTEANQQNENESNANDSHASSTAGPPMESTTSLTETNQAARAVSTSDAPIEDELVSASTKGPDDSRSSESTTAGPDVTTEASVDVVFVQPSGHNQSITVVGAAGLQRGEDPESSTTEVDDSSPIATTAAPTNSVLLDENNQSSVANSSEIFDDDSNNNSHEVQDKGSSQVSMEIVDSVEMTSDKEISTTSQAPTESTPQSTTQSASKEEIYETQYYSEENIEGSASPAGEDFSHSLASSTLAPPPFEEEIEIEHSGNPEYPNLPDDVSIHGTQTKDEDVQSPQSSRIIFAPDVDDASIFGDDTNASQSSSTQRPNKSDGNASTQERSSGEYLSSVEHNRNGTLSLVDSAEFQISSQELIAEKKTAIESENELISAERASVSGDDNDTTKNDASEQELTSASNEETANDGGSERGFQLFDIPHDPFARSIGEIHSWFKW